ncbi:MAG: FHA domain-containing protein, partial [Microcystis sp. M058S1]|nr:FHA domain-containing protein [Microcystis sp. M058S1]
MYDRLTSISFLKQISADHQNINRSEIVVPLGDRPITLGRDPICEVAIDINMYGSVSRRHAEIRAIFVRQKFEGWEICDLDSANGTFINDRRLYSC